MQIIYFSKWKNYEIVLQPKRISLTEGGYNEGKRLRFEDHLLKLDEEKDKETIADLESNAYFKGDFWRLENNTVPVITRSVHEGGVNKAPVELAKEADEIKQQAKEAAQEKRMQSLEDMVSSLTDVIGKLVDSNKPKKEEVKPKEEDKV